MNERNFSVAMSVYKNDSPVFFDRALDSITTHQTVLPTEIVLVVDGPIPVEVDEVIEKYDAMFPALFHTIKLPQNGGLGNALRIAVENASCGLIARMDSDDVAVADRFEQQLKIFEKEENVDIVGGDISEFVGDESNIVAKRVVPVSDKEIKEYMRTRCALNHVSVMFKKQVILDCGNYLDLFWNEDYYLWIRMVERGCKMMNTGSVLVNVRTGTEMYKRRGGLKYFRSEKFLQDYMLQRKMISFSTYLLNLTKRMIVQVLLPPSVRGWVFRTFARR